MKIPAILLAFTLCVTFSAAQSGKRPYKKVEIPKGGVTLPMLESKRLVPVIEVMINGHGPYRFALDTCAGGGAHVSDEIVKEAGLPQTGMVQMGDGTGQNMVQAPTYKIDSLAIGGLKLTEVEASARPRQRMAGGESIDGVLGFRLFSEGLLKIDYKGKQVIFGRGSLKKSDATLDLKLDMDIASVPVSVGSETYWAHMDSGSEGGFAMPEAEREKVAKDSPTRVMGHARTNFNEFDIVGAKLQQPMKLGSYDMGLLEAAFVPMFKVVNIGERVLRKFDSVEFDQKHRLVRLNGYTG